MSLFVEETENALIKAWFDLWNKFVVDVDFESARLMFEEDVISFGTWMDTVEGREDLVEKQWKTIWPKIKDFEFLTDTLQVRFSPDRLFAIAILIWKSTGFHKNGDTYYRPGRATVSLRRDNIQSPWKGTHTHLSLCRNVPQKSYGALS